ncbi:hypothetical protein BS17DRAFT_372222 [Gyrodon lividus]|nr:hypothetical protein BS17DRAFT_372222 [Gyrodon lividus]
MPSSQPCHMQIPLTAWKAIKEFATTEMSLPDIEKQVQDILGTRYNDADWRPAFKAVMDAEGNTGAATVAVEKLAQAAASHTGLKSRIPACRPAPQLATIEKEVMESISQLKPITTSLGSC